MARKSGSIRNNANLRRLTVWIKREDLVKGKFRHLFGKLHVWGVDLAHGKEWVELREVRRKVRKKK